MPRRDGTRQSDRKALLEQAKQGAAVLWCTACDHFWREWADPKTGWVKVFNGQRVGCPPGECGCPKCKCIYVIWENYPEWQSLR